MNANPSINPADLDTLTGAFRHIFNKFMQSVAGIMPARVVSFTRGSASTPARARVQPLISTLTTDGQLIQRAEIANIPVAKSGGGGIVIDFNLQPGDLGIIVACDRDISLFLQSLSISGPNTLRVKDFGDSIFIPLIFANYNIAVEDVNNTVIQTLDGVSKISIGADEIFVVSPNVHIDTEIATILATTEANVTTPQVNITSSTAVNVATPVLAVVGDITATGSITPFV